MLLFSNDTLIAAMKPEEFPASWSTDLLTNWYFKVRKDEIWRRRTSSAPYDLGKERPLFWPLSRIALFVVDRIFFYGVVSFYNLNWSKSEQIRNPSPVPLKMSNNLLQNCSPPRKKIHIHTRHSEKWHGNETFGWISIETEIMFPHSLFKIDQQINKKKKKHDSTWIMIKTKKGNQSYSFDRFFG